MSGSPKTVRVANQELASQSYGSREEGQVLDVDGNFPQRFHRWIKLDNSDAKPEHGRWSNAGWLMKQMSKGHSNSRQIWSQWHLNCKHGGRTIVSPILQDASHLLTKPVITYWLCDAIAPGNLRLGSSLMTLGFSMGTTIVIIFLGHFLISLAITANAVIGAKYHIPYTIQSRSSFGFYFSFVVVFIRLLVGFFWYGINTV